MIHYRERIFENCKGSKSYKIFSRLKALNQKNQLKNHKKHIRIELKNSFLLSINLKGRSFSLLLSSISYRNRLCTILNNKYPQKTQLNSSKLTILRNAAQFYLKTRIFDFLFCCKVFSKQIYDYYRQTLQQSMMEQAISRKILFPQHKLNYQGNIKNQIEQMCVFQTNILAFFQTKDRQLLQKNAKLKQTAKMTLGQAFKVKQLLNQFVYQCKNQWTMIWQQFFSLFQRIVDLYKMKIEKLEEKIVQKDTVIQRLRLSEKPLETSIKNIQIPPFNNQQHQEVSNSISKREEAEILNEKLQKRVKISDVIAEYNQSNITSCHLLTSFAQAVTQENDQSEFDQTEAPKVLMDIASQLNRQSLASKFSRESYRNHSERMTENYCEMSAILSAESSKRCSPIKENRGKKHSLRANKQNSLIYSKKMKENEDCKKRSSYFSKNAKPHESQVLGTGCKLDELRKNLLQRKKSQHLL